MLPELSFRTAEAKQGYVALYWDDAVGGQPVTNSYQGAKLAKFEKQQYDTELSKSFVYRVEVLLEPQGIRPLTLPNVGTQVLLEADWLDMGNRTRVPFTVAAADVTHSFEGTIYANLKLWSTEAKVLGAVVQPPSTSPLGSSLPPVGPTAPNQGAVFQLMVSIGSGFGKFQFEVVFPNAVDLHPKALGWIEHGLVPGAWTRPATVRMRKVDYEHWVLRTKGTKAGLLVPAVGPVMESGSYVLFPAGGGESFTGWEQDQQYGKYDWELPLNLVLLPRTHYEVCQTGDALALPGFAATNPNGAPLSRTESTPVTSQDPADVRFLETKVDTAYGVVPGHWVTLQAAGPTNSLLMVKALVTFRTEDPVTQQAVLQLLQVRTNRIVLVGADKNFQVAGCSSTLGPLGKEVNFKPDPHTHFAPSPGEEFLVAEHKYQPRQDFLRLRFESVIAKGLMRFHRVTAVPSDMKMVELKFHSPAATPLRDSLKELLELTPVELTPERLRESLATLLEGVLDLQEAMVRKGEAHMHETAILRRDFQSLQSDFDSLREEQVALRELVDPDLTSDLQEG